MGFDFCPHLINPSLEIRSTPLAQGSPYFKWRGWSKDFFRFEIFDSGNFLGRNIWQVFSWGWLDLIRDFLGVFKIIWRFVVVPTYSGRVVLPIKYNQIKYNVLYHLMLSRNFRDSEIRHGIFGGLLFGPGIFWGFDFCLHSIIPFTWNPEYPSPRALKKQSVELVPASMGFTVC